MYKQSILLNIRTYVPHSILHTTKENHIQTKTPINLFVFHYKNTQEAFNQITHIPIFSSNVSFLIIVLNPKRYFKNNFRILIKNIVPHNKQIAWRIKSRRKKFFCYFVVFFRTSFYSQQINIYIITW